MKNHLHFPPESSTAPKFTYYPILDGIRGYAVIAVVLFHLTLVPRGFLGVDLFFVLSGFLITSLLLTEWQRTGNISLKNFYARRALRLLPALLALAGVLIIGTAFLKPQKLVGILTDSLIAIFYFSNWARILGWSDELGVFAHTWSLSIEEQFYILFPLFFVLMLSRKWQPKALVVILSGIAILTNIWRIYLVYSSIQTGTEEAANESFIRIYNGFDTHSDGLLIGCIAGIVRHFQIFPRITSFIKKPVIFAASSLVLIASVGGLFPSLWLYFGHLFVFNICVIFVILYLVGSPPNQAIQAVLGNKILLWIGKRSYGIYLWHYPLTLTLKNALQDNSNFIFYFSVTILSLITAQASYFIVEKPFLNLKKGFPATNKKPLPFNDSPKSKT